MRAKHIFLPIAAATLLGSYAIYTSVQKAKFHPELWKQAHYGDEDRDRAKLLSPLMVHVLKFGMSVDEIDMLLGIPNEVRTSGDTSALGAPHMKRIYIVEYENDQIKTLTLDFSHKMKLTNFYIGEWPTPILF